MTADWKPPAETVKPHPQNSDGPFYIEAGCCMTCGVTVETAPEIFD